MLQRRKRSESFPARERPPTGMPRDDERKPTSRGPRTRAPGVRRPGAPARRAAYLGGARGWFAPPPSRGSAGWPGVSPRPGGPPRRGGGAVRGREVSRPAPALPLRELKPALPSPVKPRPPARLRHGLGHGEWCGGQAEPRLALGGGEAGLGVHRRSCYARRHTQPRLDRVGDGTAGSATTGPGPRRTSRHPRPPAVGPADRELPPGENGSLRR